MLKEYMKHKKEREARGIPARPLTAEQVEALIMLIGQPGNLDRDFLLDLLENRVPAGVDEAAGVKARFLYDIATARCSSPLISPERAVFLLSTMGGGYNIRPLIALLNNEQLADDAAKALSRIILVFDAFDEILDRSKTNPHARRVIQSWADAGWYSGKN